MTVGYSVCFEGLRLQICSFTISLGLQKYRAAVDNARRIGFSLLSSYVAFDVYCLVLIAWFGSSVGVYFHFLTGA
jgi:hypothetical protein